MALSSLSSSYFNRRPVDTQQDSSGRGPLTEWEYDAKHVGEQPRQDWRPGIFNPEQRF